MIDKATVDRIINTANIVDVVSDFVSLRRRGQNWVGLCPFHNDRNPSFYVSRSKGICKCFSCGKGGSPVNFIMEHQQMSYVEALRYLAAKYHIEIQERELTDEERAAQTERESMMIINEWACKFFEEQLHNTRDGQDIGMAYYRERGFSDATIKKFHLGYSPEGRTTLLDAAVKQGFSRELLVAVGLCIEDEQGRTYDRFRGRVMFPITNVAGKVVAFAGRTLKKNDKAKYVNSPESTIYSKRNELYGLSQAKREISKLDKCFIVEGYADVISMHQAGFENVVASSGTALTEGQIHSIHRFTTNVTEMFDGDAAGIHAALRGVDLLLKQGLNIKVLVLPDDEDPDSYARAHNHSQIEQFITDNEEDFIRFKSRMMLEGAENDPVKRAAAIGDVIGSIAVIPNAITRTIYAKELATRFGIDEEIILREINKAMARLKEEEAKRKTREQNRGSLAGPDEVPDTPPTNDSQDAKVPPQRTERTRPVVVASADIVKQERNVIRMVMKYGMCYMCDTEYDDGQILPTCVAEYVRNEMSIDRMEFTHPTHRRVFDIALTTLDEFNKDFAAEQHRVEQLEHERLQAELQKIDVVGHTADSLRKEEESIQARLVIDTTKRLNEFRRNYLEHRLCSHPDNDVRNMACDLVSEKYQLSKIHTQFAVITTEFDRLGTLLPELMYNWKYAIVMQQIQDVHDRMKKAEAGDIETLMQDMQLLYDVRSQLAKKIGERVVNP